MKSMFGWMPTGQRERCWAMSLSVTGCGEIAAGDGVVHVADGAHGAHVRGTEADESLDVRYPGHELLGRVRVVGHLLLGPRRDVEPLIATKEEMHPLQMVPDEPHALAFARGGAAGIGGLIDGRLGQGVSLILLGVEEIDQPRKTVRVDRCPCINLLAQENGLGADGPHPLIRLQLRGGIALLLGRLDLRLIHLELGVKVETIKTLLGVFGGADGCALIGLAEGRLGRVGRAHPRGVVGAGNGPAEDALDLRRECDHFLHQPDRLVRIAAAGDVQET